MQITVNDIINFLEDEWNCYNANLEYTVEDINGKLYMQGVNICDISLINSVSCESDAMLLHLKDNSKVVACVHWVYPEDTIISQISIVKGDNWGDSEMLYDIM